MSINNSDILGSDSDNEQIQSEINEQEDNIQRNDNKEFDDIKQLNEDESKQEDQADTQENIKLDEEQEQKQEDVKQNNKILGKEELKKQFEENKEILNKKGVCYISRIPPYMTATFLRGLLEDFGIERMYLVPELESKRLMRQKRGGNKSRSYVEGWVEFTDKRVARAVAEQLNCTKMVNKKNSFYSEDLWSIKYLPKFKWNNLTEKFAYDAKMRKQKMAQQMIMAKKERDFINKKMEEIEQ
ncbi:hypothetical protein PPERSA_01157 [Pseudocohnilembus persalinus]|uniref:RRM domain-containing protein n=1 Tax=Pseudocohnilembus persalinus TaxID=266149 RepID=A0A0V0QUU3_PSEPJ|nr:hypothetical protein PPERSA_01157 [Pseudocohnilembus persalinus]|eukprot:KRX06079.1 hypothetical protein PPERSA_01157 [Pseudocohnilembus persalinus]